MPLTRCAAALDSFTMPQSNSRTESTWGVVATLETELAEASSA